jgi:ABC-type polysaccharide/polyol phosphate transport system ATPase subunit
MKRIELNNISKKFKIGVKKRQSALSRFVSYFSGQEPKKIIWALRDVSFSVSKGEIVGIIGKNASGKSTLLRVIAGIYKENQGVVSTSGKVISLINLNLGMMPRLSMKDNIYLTCSLFGLTNQEVDNNFNSILDFSELADYINTKIYQFSEGMKQRLAFSIAMHCNPNILLLDEVFEVGDEAFRDKSALKIQEFINNEGAVILVSHELTLLEKHCNKIIWLDQGRVVVEDKPREVISRYLQQDDSQTRS